MVKRINQNEELRLGSWGAIQYNLEKYPEKYPEKCLKKYHESTVKKPLSSTVKTFPIQKA